MAEQKKVKDSEKRKLVKTDDGKFKLTIRNDDTEYLLEQVFSKDKLKDVHSQLKPQYENIKNQLNHEKAMLKKMDVEDSEELRNLREQLKKIGELNKKVESENNIKSMQKDLDRLKTELSEIEFVIPELKRN